MRSRFSAQVLLCVGVWAALASGAGARGPAFPFTRHYKFLPPASVLHQQGGFAGVDVDYNVVGTFDFVTTPSLLAVYPPVIIGDFDKVQAAGKRGLQNFPLNLDDAINLSGLEGSSGLHGPTNVFHFTGKTGDGSSVELHAATRGPWLYMRGATTPPPGSADFFEYRIKALAHERPSADFNDDGAVDGADLAQWSAPSGGPGSDFLAWQAQFGEAPPSETEFEAAIAAASLSASTAAPEPGSLVLAVAAVTFLFATRRR